MTVYSKIHQGLQRRGDTALDSSILVEQTGPMIITVRAGDWITEKGETYTLPVDMDHTVPSNPNYDTLNVLEFTNPSAPTTELLSWKPGAGDTPPDPTYERIIFPPLIGSGWLVVPAGASSLPDFRARTTIDNVGIKTTAEGSIIFFGRGQESGREFEFDEIEHFARGRGKAGTIFYHPADGSVSRGKKGDRDAVKIKDVG